MQAVAFAGYLNKDKDDARHAKRMEVGLQILDSLGVTYLEEEEVDAFLMISGKPI